MNTYETVIDYIFTNHPELIPQMDMNRIAGEPRVTWTLIQMYPQYLFNSFTASNPNLTMQIVLDNIYYNWNWTFFSMNKCVTFADVVANPDLPWDWVGLSQNDNMTWDIISQNLDKPWDWISVYQKPVV